MGERTAADFFWDDVLGLHQGARGVVVVADVGVCLSEIEQVACPTFRCQSAEEGRVDASGVLERATAFVESDEGGDPVHRTLAGPKLVR